jgi:Tfp pilus assembly protein PilF
LRGFQHAAAAFEAERRDSEHVPGWGAAEAYVYLAKCQLDRGATLDARDALERALLIAPEFAEARRLMTRITSG